MPNRTEIVGKWMIDEASLQRMKSVGASYHLSKIEPDENILIFRPDGSCSFKTYSSFDSDDYYLSSEGKWSLKMEETVGGSGIQRPAVVIELRPDASSHVSTHFWIVREGGRLVLWNYIGDPDYERYATFHQAP